MELCVRLFEFPVVMYVNDHIVKLYTAVHVLSHVGLYYENIERFLYVVI